MEFGSLAMRVPDKSNSVNEVKFPSESGSSLNLLQCRKEKHLSFTSAPTSFGKSVKFEQSIIFNSINDRRSPMKLSILFRPEHLARVNLSKAKHLEMFGIVVMPEHQIVRPKSPIQTVPPKRRITPGKPSQICKTCCKVPDKSSTF
ncbi:hypothetical protein EUGRSUZ_C03133 [Eucalyptus grandis]|uniref:Uncharacterized protein n=2 Tax=Eucalyptus grandis TaxID=71139 RepID=A0ACC3LIN3_EUCGR|nr:hypothetical protein EUGRSUZ_C03133 [Eucalyptus grandis]